MKVDKKGSARIVLWWTNCWSLTLMPHVMELGEEAELRGGAGEQKHATWTISSVRHAVWRSSCLSCCLPLDLLQTSESTRRKKTDWAEQSNELLVKVAKWNLQIWVTEGAGLRWGWFHAFMSLIAHLRRKHSALWVCKTETICLQLVSILLQRSRVPKMEKVLETLQVPFQCGWRET